MTVPSVLLIIISRPLSTQKTPRWPRKPRKSTLLELFRALFTLGDTVKYVSHIYDLIYEYRIYIPIAFRTQVAENLNELPFV